MNGSDPQRPDPDALLAQIQAQAQRAARGKLRIYFGASAGVGKTYAMLKAARELQSSGTDLLIGIIETHGRADTAALLDGLPQLPLASIAINGAARFEFDLDTALANPPTLLLIDELAHSNAPGSRHAKRWQDVDELLAAGIDVFTTLNVQHLESLNDVVGGITGIRIAETLPDRLFDSADEVVLVDLPADELLARLQAGKVYQPLQAQQAARNFFRKGNMIALRELALRRTAERIQHDVRNYRIEQSIDAVWNTEPALLACVGPYADAEALIRSAARLARQLQASWQAVYVETPRLQRLPAAHRERILQTLRLARELGATTAVLAGHAVAATLIEHARTHNFSRLMIGRSRARWPAIGLARRLAKQAPQLDLIEPGEAAAPARASPVSGAAHSDFKSSPRGYCWAGAASLLTAALATPLLLYLDLANIVMLFLLTVVLVAVRWGRGPALLSTVVGVAAFDFFFVPPRFSFAVGDAQYLVTFAVMLAVGWITAHLTANLRYQARVAAQREARSRALYEFARELSAALQTTQIFELTRVAVARTFQAKATLLVPDAEGRLQAPPTSSADASCIGSLGVLDIGIAQWAFDHATAAGIGTDTLPGNRFFYLPLQAPMRTRGVLAIEPHSRRWILIPEQRQQLDTFATLAAIALERVHYIEVAQDALVRIESERLRNAVLASLSHDLRTPLTALVGLSETLAASGLDLAQQELAEGLHAESLRMSRLVANLLEMARIESGAVRLDLQWQPLEEVVGSALRASRSFLGRHQIGISLAADLPLLRFDAALIERVLCNLLENASKYTPPDSSIELTARVSGAFAEIAVSDNGPGLPNGKEDEMFDKFVRGAPESAVVGVGLGLAICRAILVAHGGTIGTAAAAGGGLTVWFRLPLGTPPNTELEPNS